MVRIQIAVLLILFMCAGSLSAQWIYSQGFAAMTGTPELQRINLVDHSFVRLVGMGDMGDIAFHPDQRLLGVVFDKVYLIDTVTSAYNELYDIGDFESVGMTIDYNGKMYFSGINPTTNRYGIAIFNPVTSTTRIVADFGPINQGFINDLEFYNGELFVVGELPSSFSEKAVLFRVDTSGFNQHDTIVQYAKWPGRALAAVSDTCGTQFLVSPTTSLLNYFYPPLDSVHAYDMITSGGLFYSSGATSRSSYLGSLSPLKITDLDVFQDPCTGSSNALVTVHIKPGRVSSIQYSVDSLPFQNSNVFVNVPPGQHIFLIKDSWGCEDAITLEIIDMPAFPLSIAVDHSYCGDDNGAIHIHSLESGLQFALDNFVFSEDTLFDGLGGGNHNLVIRNDEGCADTMQINVLTFPAPIFSVAMIPEQCHAKNGMIEINEFSGVSPFHFSLDGAEWQDATTFDQLSAGIYTVYMRDALHCIIEETVVLAETGNPEIENIEIVPEECGKADGRIEVEVVSEHGPLFYSLDDNINSALPEFRDLIAGMYALSITDTFGCMTEILLEVPETGGPIIEDLIVMPEYCGKANGTIQIVAFSEHTPLRYSINNGLSTSNPSFTDLVKGEYSIIVEDTNGCKDQAELMIEGIKGIEIDSVLFQDSKCDLENGQIRIHSETHLSNEYSLDGLNYHPGPFFTNLQAGIYTVYLLSHKWCIDSAVVSINALAGVKIDEISILQPTCQNDQSMVSFLVRGGEEFIYLLDDSITNENGNFSNLSTGLHEINISNEHGCTVDTNFVIEKVSCPFYIPNVFSPNGDGVNDAFGLIAEETTIRVNIFEIYDRWGNIVYACKTNLDCSWDGTIKGRPASEGVYLYHVSILELDKERELAGQVTLLR